MDELGRVAAANGQANNGLETKLVATTSSSMSTTPIIRGRGRCAATPQVVTSPKIPPPTPHASPQPK